MYEDILLPYDGSNGASAVLHHASEIAHWADATVHVLFVADTTRDSVTVVEGRTVDTLVRQGEDVIEEATATLETLGVDYTSTVRQGNPAPTIGEYADETDQDLIVLPTQGREGLSGHLIGSVTEKVVRLSSIPVLAARMQPDERLAFPYEDVLIPTDGSFGATAAVQHGLSLASTLDATVHALSVTDDTSLLPDFGDDEVDDAAATEAIDDLVSAADDYDVPETVRHVEQGDPAERIREYVEVNDVDVVVMGTTGHRGTDRILLGSVAEKTLRSVPVPVITVGESD